MKIYKAQQYSLFFSLGVLLLLFIFSTPSLAQVSDRIDLSGTWRFKTDPLEKGTAERWFTKHLTETVTMPGSMTTNGKGEDIALNTQWTGSVFDSSYFRKPEYAEYRKAGHIKVPFWLQPVKYYKGAAWYQKEIVIPASWQGKTLELYLERCHWESKAWIDRQELGTRNSLSVPHTYAIQALKPGRHTLTIRIDNRVKKIDVGANSHSITDHTQTNWNGMIGSLFIKSKPPIIIDDMQLFPDIKKKGVTVKLKFLAEKSLTTAAIRLQVTGHREKTASISGRQYPVKFKGGVASVELFYSMGNDFVTWDEFSPELYNMNMSVKTASGEVASEKVPFGMREISTHGRDLLVNGRKTFLRGTLDCAAFPKTGFPPTDMASWLSIFKTCRSYGLNHIRFHSWCPPDAAFKAADSLGVYLQIECASWANQGAVIGDGTPLDQYIIDESKRIVKEYGNHPSFCMLAYGNEPAGRNHVTYLKQFVRNWKARDKRRIYTTGAGWPVVPENDYNSHSDPRIQHWEEGLKSIINSKRPSTDYNWASIINQWPQPTVSHEIGQWCVYPDFKEIARYDGVLKARNFEIFRDRLSASSLDSLSDEFLYASGRLQTLCYKADIEAALRTPSFGGFQLLGLNDFSGQGTALVGVLNAFWQEKGYVNGNEFSRFCSPVVPLAKLPKMIYLNNEELTAGIEIAQFGNTVLKAVVPTWTIEDKGHKILFSGKLPAIDISIGHAELGSITQDLKSVTVPSQLKLTVKVENYENSWDIFVYPAKLPKADTSVLVTQKLDERAVSKLNSGGKVLLSIKKGALAKNMGGDIQVGFSSIFWNTAWTNGQPPFTLGVLVDPKHPALQQFPTEKFSNWQWWDAMSHSGTIRLDEVKPGLKPIVRVIDDWFTARSLGLVFECKVGNGTVVVSAIDLLTNTADRPEAKQLLHSLQSYMATSSFAPTTSIALSALQKLQN